MNHLIFYILILGCGLQAYGQGLSIGPRSSILIDHQSGQVLHSEHADLVRFPASLTKVMTLYIVFDEIKAGNLSPEEQIFVSERASRMCPTKLYLRPGQKISVHNAILGITVKSANDAAAALAEHISGTEAEFAKRMTQKAAELGMASSVFYNASGLPHHQQFSTARDMAVLSRALIQDHPEFYSYFSAKSFLYKGIEYKNSNKLLHRLEGVDGIKTGYTPYAGCNLIASHQTDNRRTIGVVMGETSAPRRDKVMEHLLTYNSLPLPTLLEGLRNYPRKRKKRRVKLKPSAAYWAVKTGAFRNYDQAVKYSKKVGKKKKSKKKSVRTQTEKQVKGT